MGYTHIVTRLVVLAMLAAMLVLPSYGQLSNPLSTRSISYKTTFDDPYDLNRLWIGISPLAVNASGANVNLGYGLNTRVFFGQKIQVTASITASYARQTDLQRNAAEENASIAVRPTGERRDQRYSQIRDFTPFTALELGGQYHIKDVEKKSTSRIMLTSRKARVMEFTNVDELVVNSKNRHIISARLGGMALTSTVSLKKPMERQGVDLTGDAGTILKADGSTQLPGGQASLQTTNTLYANMGYAAVYAGGAYQVIRNVAIKADKFGNLANNIAVTAYADVIYAPSPTLSNVRVATPGGQAETFNTSALHISKVGARAGFDVFYNQDLFYSFGAEVGVRPSLRGQSPYLMARLSFPTLAFKLHRARIANEVKAGGQVE